MSASIAERVKTSSSTKHRERPIFLDRTMLREGDFLPKSTRGPDRAQWKKSTIVCE